VSFCDFYKSRRVLITGHTGFLGAWLSIWLKALRAQVTGYALPPEGAPNLFTSAEVGASMNHLIGDIRDFNKLTEVFDEAKPEVVFHLAARSSVRGAYDDPREDFDVNVQGTVNVLEAVRRCPSVSTVVVVTSDKCYENHEWIFGYRENDPIGGDDPHSASKGAAELVTRSYTRTYFCEGGPRPLGAAAVRAGNAVGGGDFADHRLIPDAVRAVLSGEVLQVRSPNAVRPWQFVLEPLSGILALACRLAELPSKYSGPWNFGPAEGGAVPAYELAEHFLSHFEEGRWEDASEPAADGLREAGLLRLSTDKARHLLGWRGIFTTAEAAETAARWYKHVLIDKMNAQKMCIKDIGEYIEQATRVDAWWAV